MDDLNLTTTSRRRTQGWFVLVVISACDSVDADFHVFHARIVKACGDELLPCFAGGKASDAPLCPLEFLGGCEGPGAEFPQGAEHHWQGYKKNCFAIGALVVHVIRVVVGQNCDKVSK